MPSFLLTHKLSEATRQTSVTYKFLRAWVFLVRLVPAFRLGQAEARNWQAIACFECRQRAISCYSFIILFLLPGTGRVVKRIFFLSSHYNLTWLGYYEPWVKGEGHCLFSLGQRSIGLGNTLKVDGSPLFTLKHLFYLLSGANGGHTQSQGNIFNDNRRGWSHRVLPPPPLWLTT